MTDVKDLVATQGDTVYWSLESKALRVVGFFIFALPGLAMVGWGGHGMNDDNRLLMMAIGGVLLLFAYCKFCLASEGCSLYRGYCIVWRGFSIAWLRFHWRFQSASYPLSGVKWKVQEMTESVKRDGSKHGIIAWGIEERAKKKVTFRFSKIFADRRTARQFLNEVKSCQKTIET